MNQTLKQSTALMLFLVLLALTLSPLVLGSTPGETDTTKYEENDLHLLRGEHYLYLKASANVGEFHLRFSFPPDYQYQVPIQLDIFNDTTANIIHYGLEDDVNEPNQVINFTLGPMTADETALLHFTCRVLVKNHAFDDLPEYVEIPDPWDVPEETRTWLAATPVVQVHSLLINHKAQQLRGSSDNLIQFARQIAWYIKYHRYPLFVLQLNLGIFFSQDALTTLFINGENIGRGHLACAFFRSNNIPSRVLLAHNDQGFWTQMHYMLEYYAPDYGWVLLDPTKGETPYATKRQIINRVCYPEDEEDTKTDYIHPRMTGEERWLWIDKDNVQPHYVDCQEGSKSQMFKEGEITTDAFTADAAFFLTQQVFNQYKHYLGMPLIGENLGHFENATSYQDQALSEFSGSNMPGYIKNMNHAYNEYTSIIL